MKTMLHFKAYLVAALLLLLSVSVLISLDWLYYAFIIKPSSAAIIAAPKVQTISTMLSHLDMSISARHFKLYNRHQSDLVNMVGVPLSGYNFSILIPYSANTALSYAAQTTSGTSDQDTIYPQVIATATTILQNNGFVPTTYKISPINTLYNVIFYQRPDAICQITSYSLLDIYCSSLPELEQEANRARPIVSTFRALYAMNSLITVGILDFEPSNTAGYSVAYVTLYMRGSEIKVYAYKNLGSDWSVVNPLWFNDPQEDGALKPNCEAFESLNETRQAFAGLTCYDSKLRDISTID